MLAVALMLICGAIATVFCLRSNKSPPSTLEVTSGTPDAPPTPLHFVVQRDGYLPLPKHTLLAYGWDQFLEPHCMMRFIVPESMPTSHYEWNITQHRDARSAAKHNTILREGPEIQVNFTEVNEVWSIHVTEWTKDGKMRTSNVHSAITKYVRREIRDLTDDDRNSYLEALEKVFTLSDTEGRDAYGDEFVSHAHLTSLHNSLRYHYHGNLAFLTSHPAFQLKIEESLRSINPGLSTPYWDFLIDHDLGENWTTSVIYDQEWFGTADNDMADDYRIRGRFRDVRVILDQNHTNFPRSEHNPYGYLSTKKNLNPAPYLQRTSKVCGFSATQATSSCHHVSSCFENYTSLYDWDKCLEDYIHADLHTQLSGMWNCAVDWDEFYENNKMWVDKGTLSFLANELSNAVRSSAFDDLVTCPTTCGGQDSFATCHCRPSAHMNLTSVDDVENMTDAKVYNYLESFYSGIYSSAYLGEHYIEENYNNSGFVYTFAGNQHGARLPEKASQLICVQ